MNRDPIEIANTIDIAITSWPGNCMGIATAMVEHNLVPGVAVYGHWLGHIAPDSYFSGRRHLPFVHHGWIRTSASIIDPTRWVFEDVEPYIFSGSLDLPEYDEGGNVFRASTHSPPPARMPEVELVQLRGDEELHGFIDDVLGLPPHLSYEGEVSIEQALWLANLSLHHLGDQAPHLFRALIDAELKAFIPIDNRQKVLGERV